MPKKSCIILIIYIFIFGCTSLPVPKKTPAISGIKGRMVCYDILQKEGYVYIYKSTEKNFTDQPFAIAGPTREDGYFTIDLPPDKYYVIGRKKNDGSKSSILTENDYFSYYGGNPIIVKEGKHTFAGLTSIKIPTLKTSYNIKTSQTDTTVLQGTVTYQGMPLDSCFIYLYVDSSTDFKGPGFMMHGPIDQNGFFELKDLPENKYYIVARKRDSKDKAGPVMRGDYFGYYLYNPVDISSNSIININIPTVIKAGEIGELDEGVIKGSEMYIKGKITDKKGNPAIGVYVFAYNERVIGHKKPEFISQKSGATGEYILYLNKPGTYYIGAREFYGDSPKPGELYGLYEKTSDHSIEISDNSKIENINFIVEQILEK